MPENPKKKLTLVSRSNHNITVVEKIDYDTARLFDSQESTMTALVTDSKPIQTSYCDLDPIFQKSLKSQFERKSIASKTQSVFLSQHK